ncbi:MAG TPA: SDR family oxidoreductase [Acidimicrobiales bacterium]|nr:SDR family oxidoreductase [Acidimicrobiales bacterium]
MVTGSASGIGAACVARLGREGYRVIGIDQHDADIVADLGTVAGRAAVVEGVTSVCGGALAGVVTCAGLAGSPSRVGSLLASVNYFGTVDLLVALRPLLVAGGAGGGAVAISSNSTTVQPSIPVALAEACLAHDEERARALADEVGSMAAYPATKLAVAHWVRGHATGPDWAGQGLRLNAVAPGMIDTPMVGSMRADPEVGPMLDMLPIPLGRPGRPEEIAALVAFLLGPDGAFFCGSVVFCDGGSDAVLRTRDWPAAWDMSVRDMVGKFTS